ncbi:MAG: thermonuclease family protein [Planctomycetota bacterium]|jgi:endonuclease YncB( thermonuclease family)
MRVINRYSRVIAIVVLLLTISSSALAGQFKVTRVTDGDTVKITGNGEKITVRLVGIDAPETSKKKNQPGQPFSKKSSKYLVNLSVENQPSILPTLFWTNQLRLNHTVPIDMAEPSGLSLLVEKT